MAEEHIELARQADRRQPERKKSELQGVMRELGIQHPGEKLLIFTEAKDTLDYLIESLKAWNATTVYIHR